MRSSLSDASSRYRYSSSHLIYAVRHNSMSRTAITYLIRYIISDTLLLMLQVEKEPRCIIGNQEQLIHTVTVNQLQVLRTLVHVQCILRTS